jgi:hypothetical protein
VCRLLIADRNDVPGVCDFLARSHIATRVEDDSTVRANATGALSPAHERREIAGYVVTWNALNPGRQVHLLESDADRSAGHPATATCLAR